MNTWAYNVLTNNGLALLAKLTTGTTLKITRAVTGTGYVSPALLRDQTAVSGIKQTMTCRTYAYPEQGKCTLPCRIDNVGLTEGYTITQIGIYANDPDKGEILYMILQAESGAGTPVPSETESPGYVAEWVVNFQYGQADSVELTVDPAGTISRTEMEAHVKEALGALTPRDIGAIAEEAVYYSSANEVDIDTATQSLLLVDKKWAKDCPLCTDSGFVFIMQLFFGDPSASTSRTQIAFSYGDAGSTKPKGIALRCYCAGAWSGWSELYGPHNAASTALDSFAGPLSAAKGGTGAATAEAGFQKLFTRATINTNNLVDANTLTASGVHMVYFDSETVPDPKTYNFPHYYGILVVAKSNAYVAQTFFSVSADPVYYRSSYDGANWGDWKTIYTDKTKPNLHDLPGCMPINKGGTGTTGWHQALTNLRAMERQAMYYSSTAAPDINTLTDSLMLIPHEYSKECPVGGGFVYIMQMFYADITASNNRTQVAFPYLSDGTIGKGLAIRSCFNGTWSAWQAIHAGTLPIEKGGTGGTTQNSAIANLFCRTLINNTSVVDANILVHTGIHKVYVTDESIATTNNYPYVYGNLFVVSNMESTSYTYITQLFLTTDGHIFVRSSTNNGSTWTGWAKVYSTNNKPDPEDIGAAPVVKIGTTYGSSPTINFSFPTGGMYAVCGAPRGGSTAATPYYVIMIRDGNTTNTRIVQENKSDGYTTEISGGNISITQPSNYSDSVAWSYMKISA